MSKEPSDLIADPGPTRDERIAIVGAASEVYARHLTVAMHSAMTRIDPDRRVCAFVVDGGMRADSVTRMLHCLGAAHPRASVEIILPDAALVEGLPTCARYPAAVYLQLLIPALLPPDIERALYIDSDGVVTENVSALFDMDLQGRALWAVRDGEVDVNLNRLKASFPDVRFAEGAEYVNTGVLLIDLPLWRRMQVSERAIDLLRNHGDRCVWKNQDAINVALAGDWGLLPDKWNNRLRGHTWAFAHLAHARGGEGILHFCGHRKPWRGWCLKDEVYYDALIASRWHGPAQRIGVRLNYPYRALRSLYYAARYRLALRSRAAKALRQLSLARQ
jgi:lipopolysaccharide biosynthesis glycosyltransferase